MLMRELITVQKDLQEKMGRPLGTGITGFHNALFAAHIEVVEVLLELPWKPWKPYTNFIVDKEKLETEVCDVLQFLINAIEAIDYGNLFIDTYGRREFVEHFSADRSLIKPAIDYVKLFSYEILGAAMTPTFNFSPNHAQSRYVKLLLLLGRWSELVRNLDLDLHKLEYRLREKWVENYRRIASMETTNA